MSHSDVLVYGWDENCQRIHDRLAFRFESLERETGEMEWAGAQDLRNLLNYYKKWHYNNQLFLKTREEILSRKRVLESLHLKGYGVSTALAGDLTGFQKKLKGLHERLVHTFARHMDFARSQIYLPRSQESSHNSFYIIRELCRKLGEEAEGQVPQVEDPLPRLPIEHFLKVTEETPPYAHMAILNRMFLELAEASKTIMEGTIGHQNVDSPQHLKYLASRNLRELFTCLYDTIREDITIDIQWIKTIHHYLTRDLDASHSWRSGEFREEDFADRSGLTFEFGNFERGMEELREFLGTADWRTENLQKFITSLARLYYMLLSIHPFLDSNGRTCKCLVNHLLLRRGLPPLLFNVHEEILALPRYGGSLMMMADYCTRRLSSSIAHYFSEREKMVRFANLDKHFFRTDFDAGFYFRHLNGMWPLIEVDFKIYILAQDSPLFCDYQNRCRIVLPHEGLTENLKIYYGFTRQGESRWEMEGFQTPHTLWPGGTDSHGVPFLSTNLFIEAGPHLAPYDRLELSLACETAGLIFNNKSMNYCFLMDRNYLIKSAAERLVRDLASDDVWHDQEMAAIRRVRDALEHRAHELIALYGLQGPDDMAQRRGAVLESHRDLGDTFRAVLLPLLSQYVQSHGLTGRADPADDDNSQFLSCSITHLVPAAAALLGFH